MDVRSDNIRNEQISKLDEQHDWHNRSRKSQKSDSSVRPTATFCKDRINTFLILIQKRAILCNHLEYRSHTKPSFLKLKTLTIADLVICKSMVSM